MRIISNLKEPTQSVDTLANESSVDKVASLVLASALEVDLIMVEEASVIKVISDCLGCVEYEDLLKKLEVDDVENVIKNSDVFTVIQQNRSKKILVTTKIRRCRIRECQETCTDLHLCKYGLLGQCNT